MNPVEHLVVVGASLAGLRAVEAARRAGFTGTVTLVGAETHAPYDRPPLSKAFLDTAQRPYPPEVPWLRAPDSFTSELDVGLVLGEPATGIDVTAQAIQTSTGEIGYDALVVATGARARMLPGTEALAGVHGIRTLDDARAVRRALDAGARTVVVGAGFIGSEVASAARRRGLPVTVVEALPTPLARAVGGLAGTALATLHERNGTQLLCGAGVRAVEGSDHVERVVLDDGTVLVADLVVVGIGAEPATGWLDGSGIELGNGVVCDETLASSVPGIYAAGDVARWMNPVFGRSQRIEHWTSAAEQGAAAARNAIAPDRATAYATVPYFWSDWYDSRIQFAGSADAEEVRLVDGDPMTGGRWIVLYRERERLVGALTVNGQTEIMKYRRMIGAGATWQAGLDLAAARRASPPAEAWFPRASDPDGRPSRAEGHPRSVQPAAVRPDRPLR